MKMTAKTQIGLSLTTFLLLFPVGVLAQTLTAVQITLDDATVGQRSIHTVSFNHADTIPSDGRIVVRYPSGFDLSTVSIVSSATLDGGLSVTSAGDSLIAQRNGTGSPATAGAETIQFAVVTNRAASGNFQVIVTTREADNTPIERGTSASATLDPGPVQTFQVSLPASVTGTGAVAGTDFQADIEARDAFGNRADGFSGAVTLSDQTGTVIVTGTGTNQTTAFSSGIWSGNVRVTKTAASNAILATSGTSSGSSAAFNVLPGALDQFVFGPISSPQTAGVPFSLTITAYDGYDNIKTDYTNPATLSEKTGTVTVDATSSASTENFSSGVWTGNVRITQANTDIYIQASGGGRTGTSGPFNVNGAAVDHFTLSNISTQSAGEFFLVTITARDAFDNTAASFSGSGRRVNISHTGTGTLIPTQSGDFTGGVWTGNLRINQIQTDDRITVNDGSGHTGQSNAFNVISSTVDHFVISAIPVNQTAGVGFSVTIRAEDVNNNIVTGFTNQVVNIRDETGTHSPQQVTLVDGTWTGTISISQAMNSNVLTATALGKSGTSNPFNVAGAGVSRFEFSAVPSPRTAGTGFPVTITARDAFGNVSQSFNGTVPLSAASGSSPVVISPSVSGAFSNGTRTVTLTITQAVNDVRVTADDGAGHTGTSNAFNVAPNTLDHFAIAQIATQTPGVPFSLTVTAQDAYDNTVTGFSGPGNRVNIGHTGTGSLSRSQSDDFQSGIWSGTISVTQTQTNDRITVVRDGGTQSAISNTFNVIPTTVDHFTFDPISTPQTAGQGFSVTVRAYDVNNNLVTGFNETVNLADLTGTNDVKQITFSSGVGTATVTITKSQSQNRLTVSGLGKSGVSEVFNVNPGSVQTISVAPVASPQMAGTDFQIYLTALDTYQNIVTQFAGQVSLSDSTGTLTPAATGSFSAGLLTQTVRITGARNDVRIMVYQGGVQRGSSNLFNVLPAALNRFAIQHIGDQIVGVPFSTTLTAEDAYGNVKTNFTQTVDISDLTGTIRPDVSPNFSNGVLTTGVTVHQARTANRMRVTQTGGFIFSESNLFDVVLSPGILVSDFRAVGKDRATGIQSVTTDQDSVWYLRCTVRNFSGSEVRLDSVRLQFNVAGIVRHDYTLQLPTAFWGSAEETLPGNGIDSLLIPVLHTGSDAGGATIRLFVYLLGSGVTLSDDAFTNLLVQTPANLVIHMVKPSQAEVSRGQVMPWRVAVVATNTGGSATAIDSSTTASYLEFSLGAPQTWELTYPPSWTGDWVLEGGETDSLIFEVTRTTDQAAGLCRIDAYVAGLEMTTGRRLETDTRDGGHGQVLIEAPANLIVRQVTNRAPNSPYVNRGQVFDLFLQVENLGEDAMRDVEVEIGSSGTSSFVRAHYIGTLSGGQVHSLTVPVTASTLPGSETFTVSASGFAENTALFLEDGNSPDKTATATIQNPAVFQVLSVSTSQTLLLGGQTDPWHIKVAVRNTGGSAIELSRPSADSVAFFVGGIYQTDYKVVPPNALKGGGLILAPGVTDSLIYHVNTTGTYGGDVRIRVRAGGKDRNDLRTLRAENEAQVFIESKPDFRIISTEIATVNTTESKNGFVNTGQAFRVLVIVENGLSFTIRNIDVRMESNGLSAIENPQVLLTRLEPSRRDSVWFDVLAANQENLSGETFTSRIQGAKRENGTDDAPIGEASDPTAVVFVQSPASLSLSIETEPADGVVSVNQEFKVKGRLLKQGSSALKNEGRVRIRWPDRYQLISASDSAGITPEVPAEWRLRAPNEPSTNDKVRVDLIQYPIDKNTDVRVVVTDQFAEAPITTIASRLRSVTSISAPSGASDGILSTGQSFVVRTEMISDNVTEITARIELPFGYHTKNNLTQSASGDTVTWLVTAPTTPVSEGTLIVTARGVDALQPAVPIGGVPNALPLNTVSKADLALFLTIDSPPEAAQYGTVSLGQEFVVRAAVQNSGEAQTIGDIEVSLLALPPQYTTREVLAQTLSGGEAFWTIKAPSQPSTAAAQIESRLTKIPVDENTDQPAFVGRDYHAVAVRLQSTWLSVTPLVLSGANQSLTPGQSNVPLLGLEFQNRGETGAYPIIIREIWLTLTGREGEDIGPRSAVSRLEAVEMNGPDIYGTTAQIPEANPVRISLSGLEIPYNQSKKILIRGRIAESQTVPFFRVSVPDGQAISAREAASDRDVLVKSPTGDELESIPSAPLRIFNPNEEARLWSSPNPFGEPGRETATIYYYIPEPTSVSFRIYTLVGQLVKSYDVAESEVSAGQVNRWTWDGCNDRGWEVLNGVYHLIMQTGNGEIFKFKIAFVK